MQIASPLLTDVQLSNEFEFPIAAVHHADEAFLVPDVLKRAYGGPPATAHFATLARSAPSVTVSK